MRTLIFAIWVSTVTASWTAERLFSRPAGEQHQSTSAGTSIEDIKAELKGALETNENKDYQRQRQRNRSYTQNQAESGSNHLRQRTVSDDEDDDDYNNFGGEQIQNYQYGDNSNHEYNGQKFFPADHLEDQGRGRASGMRGDPSSIYQEDDWFYEEDDAFYQEDDRFYQDYWFYEEEDGLHKEDDRVPQENNWFYQQEDNRYYQLENPAHSTAYFNHQEKRPYGAQYYRGEDNHHLDVDGENEKGFGNDHYFDHSLGMGSSPRGSKKSKGKEGNGKGKGKGGKGTYKHDKKLKRRKAPKKRIDKKLKDPSDPNKDDWWGPEDDYYSPNSQPHDPPPNEAPIPPSMSMSMNRDMSFPTDTRDAGIRAAPRAESNDRGINNPFNADSERSGLFTGRMGNSGEEFDIPSESTRDNTTYNDADKVAQEAGLYIGEPVIGAPRVQRKLYPEPIELKAHSSVHLQKYDPEFFAETTKLLTPCLERAYPDQLQAYKLTVNFSEGPEASEIGVVITHMDIHVVISVVTKTMADLKAISNTNASQVLHDCFESRSLYSFLGALRLQGVKINEIEFQDRPFQSPIFANGEPDGSERPAALQPEPRKSRAGLIASLLVATIVLGSIAFAHKRGNLPKVKVPTYPFQHAKAAFMNAALFDRLRGGAKSLRERLNTRSSSQGAVAGFSESSQSASCSGSEQSGGKRVRSWSGSYRRYPEGGVRPAAIQKKPASSRDYLKSPGSEAYSASVSGDYNVPLEYDFQGTPVSHMYTDGKKNDQSGQALSASGTEEEFSLPDDYNTVNEEQSLYSHNIGAMDSFSTMQKSNTFMMGHPSRTISDSTDGMSMKDHRRMDEWSVPSMSTSSPIQPPNKPNMKDDRFSSTPYRDWSPTKPTESPSSNLAMPKLV